MPQTPEAMDQNLTRRNFLLKSGAVSALILSGFPGIANPSKSMNFEGKIMTVNGPIAPEDLGVCLPHEHIISRFGAGPEEFPKYDFDDATSQIVPYLQFMKELGCDSIMCCTTKYFGRDVELLQEISKESGVNIIANTGFYGAANDRYIPRIAYDLPADKIAQIWIDEFSNGIDDTGIRPGFVKIGIDNGPLSDIDGKLVRAGAICHRDTGLLLQIHTGDNLPAVKSQLWILKEEGVAPNAWVWVHAQNVKTDSDLLYAAEQGAWISLDALRTANYYENRGLVSRDVNRHLELLIMLKEHGFLNQVFLSHDGSTYPQAGKDKRSFEVLFSTFIPMMKSAGFTEKDINQLIVENPKNAFKIHRRFI